MKTSIREMTPADIPQVVDYFILADANYLKGMGADKDKLPGRAEWIKKIELELGKPFHEKEIYYVIWQVDNQAIGHSNINQISYGKQANMHLHIWDRKNRRGGHGPELVRSSIPRYFENFQLKTLVCEPYAGNPAPLKTLEEAGFEFVRTYETTPGVICFPQTVRRYEMSKARYEQLH